MIAPDKVNFNTDTADALVEGVLLVAIPLLALRIRSWSKARNADEAGIDRIVAGLLLMCPALLLDMSDSIVGLGRFIVIGDTTEENFIETALHVAAFMTVASGFRRWLWRSSPAHGGVAAEAGRPL